METSVPLVNTIINNSVRIQLAHQLDAASNQSYPELFSGRLVVQDFVNKWIEVRAVRRPEIWKFTVLTTIS